MAKSAGVDLDDWVADAMAEYAEDLGVDPQDLSDQERLEAIEERVDRLARSAPAPRAREGDLRPARRFAAADRRPERAETRRTENERVETPRFETSRFENQRPRSDSRAIRRQDDALETTVRDIERRAGERDRFAEAIDAIEHRAARNEQRTARALESLTGLVTSRGGAHDRLEEAMREIEMRAERNEERTARALESLTELVETRGGERNRLEQAIQQIEARAARNEERTARALETLTGLVDGRGEERERWDAAIKRIEERSERQAERTARAIESLTGLIDAKATAVAPPNPPAPPKPRATTPLVAPSHASPARARPTPSFDAAAPARPRAEAIEARFDELARRAAYAPAAAAPAPQTSLPDDDDNEALRLVSERLARRKKMRDAPSPPQTAPVREAAFPLQPSAPAPELAFSPDPSAIARQTAYAPQAANSQQTYHGEQARPAARSPVEAKLEEIARTLQAHDLGGAVKDLQHEMRTLADRIDGLSNAAVGASTVESIRRQADEIETVLAAAADGAAPVQRLERQIAEAGARIERLTESAASPADIAAALKTLAEAQSRIERAPSAAALASIERRIDDLGGRIEEAARRPVPDPRPLEDLARRVEHMRAAIDSQNAAKPDAAALAGKLQVINEKLDRARETGAQSAATVASLQETAARLEEAMRRPTKVSLDARPIEDLGRRIEKIRAAIEAQSARPDSAALSLKLQSIEAKLDRLAESGSSAAAVAPLQEMAARLEEAVRRPMSVSLDQRPLDDLARRIETIRVALESQGGARADSRELSAKLQALSEKLDRLAATGGSIDATAKLEEMAQRLEEAIRRPVAVALDARPLEDLARRVETLRIAFEQDGARRPDAAAIAQKMQAIVDKLDRAAESGASQSAETLARLQEMTARLEAALRRPADVQPIADLARRIDGVRGAIARQDELSPKVDQLQAAVGEIAEKLDRTGSPGNEIAGVEAALHKLSANIESVAGRSATAERRTADELAHRIESLRKAVERNSGLSPQAERLDATLADLGARLDRAADSRQIEAVDATLRKLAAKFEEAAARPATVALDTKPIEDLARRIDNVKGAVERQETIAPHVARLEAALEEIRDKLDRPSLGDVGGLDAALRELAARFEDAVKRPTTVAMDPRPIEDLARRIESMRASLDSAGLAPQVERLETALAAVAEKLDRAQPLIDANGLNATLAEMNTRLEEAFRRPAQLEIDHEPIEALVRRIEAVRDTVERQAKGADASGRPIDELSRRLEAIKTSIDRQAEQLDAGRIEEAFRKAVVKSGGAAFAGHDIGRLLSAIQGLAAKLENAAPAFNAQRIEGMLARLVERSDAPGAAPGEFGRVVEAISALDAKLNDAPALLEGERIEAALQELADRIDDQRADRADLTTAIADLAGKIERGATTLDATRIESLLEHVLSRLDDVGAAQGGGVTGDLGVVEAIVAGLDDRIAALDAKISASPAPGGFSPTDLANFELALRELAEKIEGGRGGDLGGEGAQALAEDVRLLHDKLDELALAKLDGGLVEQAARTLAEKIEARASVFDPEALLGHVAEIHDRLDDLNAARPATAELQRALDDVTEELEALRSAREAVGHGARTLTEIRTDQVQFDRRMDARFSGLQDVLEKLVDRFSRLEHGLDGGPGESRRPLQAPKLRADDSPARDSSSKPAIEDIPDRDPLPARPSLASPAADVAPLAAEIAAQGRVREPGDGAVKTAALNAHIAAARRAYNAAAESERNAETVAAPAVKTARAAGWTSRAQAMIGRNPRPVLLGGAVLLGLATLATLEMRGGHLLMRKSEIDAPANPLALGAPESGNLDTSPTGALSATPNVISAPLPAPGASLGRAPKTSASAIARPAPELVAALPAALPVELKNAAGNGDLGAVIEIAQRYLEGRTVPREPKTAAGWFQTAADSGSPFGQYRLGALYEKGIGVARDPAKAREWYAKAADAGNARAMHNLAVLYAQDGGAGKPDYAAALDSFRRAASYGVRDSQFNLGVLYGRGLGAQQDLATSWMYFSLAAKQGDADAARKRDEVANRMDGRIMAKATKMLADFKAETPDPAVNDPPAAPAQAADAPAQPTPAAKGGDVKL